MIIVRRAVILSMVVILFGGCCHSPEPYPETVAQEVFDGTVLKSELDIKIYIYNDIVRRHDDTTKTYRLLNEPDYEFIIKQIHKLDVKFERGSGGKYGAETFPENITTDNLDYSMEYIIGNDICLTTIDPFKIPMIWWTLEVELTCDRGGPHAGYREIYTFRRKKNHWYHDMHIRKMQMF